MQDLAEQADWVELDINMDEVVDEVVEQGDSLFVYREVQYLDP